VQLPLFLPAIKHLTSSEDVSDIPYQRLHTLKWMFFQLLFFADFETPFTTQWQQSGQACKLKHVFSIKTKLVTENTIFGTQQAVWKERLWGKSVLEVNIRTVAFTNGGSLRLFRVWIFIESYKRQASGTVLKLLPENYIEADSSFPLPVLSECTASSLRTIKACKIFHAHFNALFHSAHHNIFILVYALQKCRDLHRNEKCHYTKI